MIEVHDLKRGGVRLSGPARGRPTVCPIRPRQPVYIQPKPPAGPPPAGLTPPVRPATQPTPQPTEVAAINVESRAGAPDHGDGWFTWRDWKVNQDFISRFERHILSLVNKHHASLSQTNRIDPRIAALLKEKELLDPNAVQDRMRLQKSIDFFAEVFVKYLYMKTNWPNLMNAMILDILRQNSHLDNQSFAQQISQHIAAKLSQPVPAPAPRPPPQPAPSPPQLPPSPCEPINLSLHRSAAEVPLPPPPISPPHSPLPPPPPSVKVEAPSPDTAHVLASASACPTSIQVMSVYNDGGCSVQQLPSVLPATPTEVVGRGPKLLQFFYQNPVDDIKVGFPPVGVTTNEEVNCVVALVTEKAEDYNRRNNLTGRGKPVQYYSSAVQARSILHPEIVRHIERCFTKKGMKEFKAGRKKRAYPKRNQIIKVGAEYFNNMRSQAIKQEYVEDDEKYEGSEEEEEEDDVDEVEEQAVEVVEHIPTDQEMKSSLALSVLGTELPEVRRRARPPREGLSDRKGRGGRNEKEREPAQYVT